LLTPRVRFRLGAEQLERDLRPLAESFGVARSQLHDAVLAGNVAQEAFRDALAAAGRKALADLEASGELGIVIIGRPYNMYDRGVNMDIPRKLRTFYGVNLIPMDFLPLKGIDVRDVVENMYWNYGRKILQAGKFVGQQERLHIIYLTNFKCGPDSYIKHYIRAASSKPFLTLQFDEHQNDAGAMTRCEAYLDSKGFLRWWSQGGDERLPVEREPSASALPGDPVRA
jgi:predicted nucleotide-binding protein (sugar kinase/HSP70/actin superfamily)